VTQIDSCFFFPAIVFTTIVLVLLPQVSVMHCLFVTQPHNYTKLNVHLIVMWRIGFVLLRTVVSVGVM